MAVLQDSPLKCFLGEWEDHAPLCTGLTSQQVLNLSSCDCSDRWPTLETLERGENMITWLGQNTKSYTMIPSESMVSKGAGQSLILQIFFTCMHPIPCSPAEPTDEITEDADPLTR